MTDFDAKAREIMDESEVVGDEGGLELSRFRLEENIAAALKAAHNEAIERAAVRARIAQLEGSLADDRVRELKVPT